MALPPSLVLALTRLDADEQDALQTFCGGDWSTVEQIGMDLRVRKAGVLMARRFPLQPEEPVKAKRVRRLDPAEKERRKQERAAKAAAAKKAVPPAPAAPEPAVGDALRRAAVVKGLRPADQERLARDVLAQRRQQIAEPSPKGKEGPEQPEIADLVVPHIIEGDDDHAIANRHIALQGVKLAESFRRGMPRQLGYTVKADVQILFGWDADLCDDVLRHPERIEVRPESFEAEKRYVVLSFKRGDIEVIMGFRNPKNPAVIAMYHHSLLAHDTHIVGHAGTGGGGSRGETGLPKTGKQVAARLQGMQAKVDFNEDETTAEVFFAGQSLGRIMTRGDRKKSESDYQRMQRKITAIKDRIAAGKTG